MPNFSLPLSTVELPFLEKYHASKAGAKQVVRESGFAYTVLRPGWLMHNWIGATPTYHFTDYVAKRLITVSYPEDYIAGPDYFVNASMGPVV